MCLNLYTKSGHVVAFRKDSSFWQKLQKNGKVTCYKIYWKCNTHLQSYWHYLSIREPRIVKSNRSAFMLSVFHTRLTGLERISSTVFNGIHVYKNKQEYVSSSCCQVPVICRKEHFVAEGHGSEAVFTQVEITKRNWNKIFNKEK